MIFHNKQLFFFYSRLVSNLTYRYSSPGEFSVFVECTTSDWHVMAQRQVTVQDKMDQLSIIGCYSQYETGNSSHCCTLYGEVLWIQVQLNGGEDNFSASFKGKDKYYAIHGIEWDFVLCKIILLFSECFPPNCCIPAIEFSRFPWRGSFSEIFHHLKHKYKPFFPIHKADSTSIALVAKNPHDASQNISVFEVRNSWKCSSD